jgi:hypothetical protein
VTQEPLRAYEERKGEATKKELEDAKKSASLGASSPVQGPPERATKTDPAMAEGMMAGVTGSGEKKDGEPKKLLPVTAFGRYIKVLLSSNEFIFVE